MTRSIALTEPTGALLPDEAQFADMMRMAEQIAASGLVPGVTKAAGIITLMQTGQELGLRPMAAITGLHIMKDGRPSPSAKLAHALITKHHGGGAIRITELTRERCTVRYRRREWPEGDYDEMTYDIEDAKLAGYLTGVNKHNWTTKPKNMLRARAVSEVARMAFADLMLGQFDADPVFPPVAAEDGFASVMADDREEQLDQLVEDIIEAESREVIEDPPDEAYQPYVATGDIDADHEALSGRLYAAVDLDELALVWTDINRVGLARDEELLAIKDQMKAALAARPAPVPA